MRSQTATAQRLPQHIYVQTKDIQTGSPGAASIRRRVVKVDTVQIDLQCNTVQCRAMQIILVYYSEKWCLYNEVTCTEVIYS